MARQGNLALVDEPDAKRRECTVRLPRWLEKLAAEEAERRTGTGRQVYKAGVYYDAIKQYLAGRGASGSLGEQLAQAREAAGLTVSDVWRLTETGGKALAPSVIWRIENNAERSPRLSSLQTLAAALEVSIVIDPHGVAVLRRQT